VLIAVNRDEILRPIAFNIIFKHRGFYDRKRHSAFQWCQCSFRHCEKELSLPNNVGGLEDSS